MTDFSVKLFISYAHLDIDFQKELVEHLANLRRQGMVEDWHDRKIMAGEKWAGKIDEALNEAQIILLLISSSFMNSNYCHDIEMVRAMERYHAGEAEVIPIVIRECDWTGAPFSQLQALPKDAKPVDNWSKHDPAWADVVRGIRTAIEALQEKMKALFRAETGLSEALADELFERLATVSKEKWANIYARCKPNVAGNTPANIWQAALELLRLNHSRRGLDFVAELGHQFKRPELTKWAQQASAHFNISIAEPALHSSSGTLLFQVEPLESHPGSYNLHAWLWQNNVVKEPLTETNQDPKPWLTVADEIQFWVTLKRSEYADLAVELALPRQHFCCDITQWKMREDETLLRQLPLFLRCHKRFNARRQKLKAEKEGLSRIELQKREFLAKSTMPVRLEDWQRKCLRLNDHSQDEAVTLLYRLDPQLAPDDLNDDFREETKGIFVAFGCQPESDQESSIFWRALDYGAPLVVWFREYPKGEVNTVEELIATLELNAQVKLGELPKHIWNLQKTALRKKDRADLHYHLTILCDDYERVPDPS